jgi:hypothetical protein
MNLRACESTINQAIIIWVYLYLTQTKGLDMRLAIVGSRHFDNYEMFCELIEDLNKLYEFEYIVSGGATGADSLAERYAREHAIPFRVYPANWAKFGKSAGYRRNVQIVGDADYMVAFWDYKSPGTKHSIKLARERKIPGKIFRIP